MPSLLLWPLSVAITFIVARSIADAPYDRRQVDNHLGPGRRQQALHVVLSAQVISAAARNDDLARLVARQFAADGAPQEPGATGHDNALAF